MSTVGISHPSVLDLVTQSDREIRLILIEERALSSDDAPALQEKLNNCLGYALDGELLKNYPESQGKQVLLRLEFNAPPAPFITEFIHKYREAVAQYKVQMEFVIQGNSFYDPADA